MKQMLGKDTPSPGQYLANDILINHLSKAKQCEPPFATGACTGNLHRDSKWQQQQWANGIGPYTAELSASIVRSVEKQRTN